MMSDLNSNPPGGTVDAGVGFWGGNWGLDGVNGAGVPVEVQVDLPGVVGRRVGVKGYGGRKRTQDLSDGYDADGVWQLLRHWRHRGLQMWSWDKSNRFYSFQSLFQRVYLIWQNKTCIWRVQHFLSEWIIKLLKGQTETFSLLWQKPDSETSWRFVIRNDVRNQSS